MMGETLKTVMEDVADNIFNPDPYYQQGGDMVRVGGIAYAIDLSKGMGERISDLTLTDTGEAIDRRVLHCRRAATGPTKEQRVHRSGMSSRATSARPEP